MRLLYLIFLAIPLAAFATTSDDVLAKLDDNASKFSGMTANLTRLTYTKVIDDKTTEQGTIALKKQGPKDIQVLIDFTKPDPRTVAFRGRKAEIYYPKIKTVQEIDLGKRTDLMDQFMLVGFGTSGKELKANYSVKLAGEEAIAGQKAHRLQLTPLKTAAAAKLQPLELWISDAGGYPVQQKFVQPSGDYHLFTYQDVKLDPQLGDEALRLKLPKGVKREFPQK
jgi:outer membrane lipoprotein-sorting protein